MSVQRPERGRYFLQSENKQQDYKISFLLSLQHSRNGEALPACLWPWGGQAVTSGSTCINSGKVNRDRSYSFAPALWIKALKILVHQLYLISKTPTSLNVLSLGFLQQHREGSEWQGLVQHDKPPRTSSTISTCEKLNPTSKPHPDSQIPLSHGSFRLQCNCSNKRVRMAGILKRVRVLLSARSGILPPCS